MNRSLGGFMLLSLVLLCTFMVIKLAPMEFELQEWTNNPNYAVLIDTRDRLIPQLGYVAQENIELHSGRVFHGLLKNYMERYDEIKQKFVHFSGFRLYRCFLKLCRCSGSNLQALVHSHCTYSM